MSSKQNPLGLADPRETLAGVKDVASDRIKFKRPIRLFTVLTWPNGKPMIRFALTVTVVEKTCVYLDSSLKEHRITVHPGALDFSQGIPTVKMETLNQEGNVIDVACLSHERQYAVDRRKSDFRNDRIIFYRVRGQLLTHRTPNALLPTCYPEKGSAKLIFWQQMADSDKAVWLDGAEPSEADIEGAEKLREERRAQRAKARQADAVPAGAPADEDGPDGPEEIGQDF